MARELGIDLPKTSIKWTYHAGEPGGNVPTTRRAIEEAWGARAYELYGIGEVGAIAPGCPLQRGVHLAEDQSYATVVDPESGRPVGEGDVGENLVTSYIQFSQPVIKYRSHDLVRLVRKRCECGRTWMLFEGGVLGRTGDELAVKVEASPEAGAGDYEGLRQRAERLLYERIMVRIAVEVEPPGALPRYELKAKRFFDHRPHPGSHP